MSRYPNAWTWGKVVQRREVDAEQSKRPHLEVPSRLFEDSHFVVEVEGGEGCGRPRKRLKSPQDKVACPEEVNI